MVPLPLYNFVNVGDTGPPSLFIKLEPPGRQLGLPKSSDIVPLSLYYFFNLGEAGPPFLFYKTSPDLVSSPLYDFVHVKEDDHPLNFERIS
jgi:hypothetical protein